MILVGVVALLAIGGGGAFLYSRATVGRPEVLVPAPDPVVKKDPVVVVVKPPPEDERWNYLTGITTKWHRSFFYLVGHYASPGPDALSPTFESRFARMEYAGGGRFHLAYFRHTGKWWEVYRDLKPDEAINPIRDHGIFHPA